MSAQATSGSTMPALVVPAVATSMTGTQPCWMSSSTAAVNAAGSMRPVPSVAISLTAERPMPACSAILIQAMWHSRET